MQPTYGVIYMDNRNVAVTEGNFTRVLGAVVKGATRQRDVLQQLIIFALAHFAEHGNTHYLTVTLNACIGVKSLPTKTMKEFIQAHANVTWTKTTDGTMVFRKQGKDIQVTMPTTLWYDFSKSHQAAPDLDVVARIKSLATAIEHAISDGKIKPGQERIADKARELLSQLQTPDLVSVPVSASGEMRQAA